MSEIPPQAVRAVAEILRAWEVDQSGEGDLAPVEEFDADARELLDVAAPMLLAKGRAEERARIAAHFRVLAARYEAVPGKGLTIGQIWDRDQQAWFWRDLADKTERGDRDG